MTFATKDKITFDKRKVIGLKLKTKPNLVKEQDFKEFLDKCTCNFSIIMLSEDNQLHCKWYDEETGDIYFHFERPMPYSIVDVWFPEEEMIFEIKND